MKLLLTGSGGFIGQNLLAYFSHRAGYEIVAPRRAELNLLDERSVSDYLSRNRFDAVLHLAKTDVVYDKSVTDYTVLDANLRMFFNLEKHCRKYGRLIYTGSGAEYGRDEMPPLVREETLGTSIPKDPYGFAKFIMSRAAARSENIYELCLFGVYGKYEDYTRRFISNNLCRAIKNLPMTLRQNAKFDYLYIGDLCRMIEQFLLIEPQHHHYNVCSGAPIELKTLAGMIRTVIGEPCELQIAADGMQREYSGSNLRLLSEIGAFTFTPHIRAIEELYKYYLSHAENIDAALI